MSENVESAPAYQVRFHGRGGQGAVTAAQICMIAFEGKGTCMPNFGAERMGAPVMSFARMSKDYEKVRTNEQVYSPQYVCVLDDTLLFDVDTTEGIVPGGYLIVNSKQSLEEIQKTIDRNEHPPINIAIVDATGLALEYLGRNITNTIIIGGLLKVGPQLFSVERLGDAIAKQFKARIAQANMDAIKVAPGKTELHMLTDTPLDFDADYKKEWSHLEMGKLGSTELDKAGIWYTDTIDGGSRRVKTGAWGVSVAKIDLEKCTNCHMCVFICPDLCILREEQEDGTMKVVGIDDYHCKGCGDCVEVCLSNALKMEMKK